MYKNLANFKRLVDWRIKRIVTLKNINFQRFS